MRVRLLLLTCLGAAARGFAPRQAKILGGTPALSIGEFPYQLSLRVDGMHICGAVLISASAALSAAHCMVAPPRYLSIRAGSPVINSGGCVRRLRGAFTHPLYDASRGDYDLSALLLDEPLQATLAVRPIALPAAGERLQGGKSGLISGWGSRWISRRPSLILRSAVITVVDLDECRRLFPPGAITERMICAGSAFGIRDSCKGDSGGPFVVDSKLFGIVSWGFSCGNPAYPGVYTNVAALRDFIRNHTGV